MIRINLATKKRSAAVQALEATGAGGEGGGGLLDRLRSFKIGGGASGDTGARAMAALSFAQAWKIGVAVLAVAVAYFYFGSQKEEELGKVRALVTAAQAEQAKLNAKVQQTSGYQAKKAQLEKDEKILRTKIETIKKLTDERDVPSRLMRELAEGVPGDLWFSAMDFDEEKRLIVLRGKSYAEASVNAFNKLLSSNAMFSGSEIKETTTERDSAGTEMFAFLIEARRK